MKKEVVSLLAILIILPAIIFAVLVLDGTTTYNSTDINVAQEAGFAHLNVSDGNLILYMPFDYNSSSGVVYDYSNNSNDGTMRNFDNNYTVNGFYGGGQVFDGTNDYINVDNDFILDYPFTFSGFFKSNPIGGTLISIGDSTDTSIYYVASISSGTGYFTVVVRNDSTQHLVADSQAHNDGSWHSFSVVFKNVSYREAYVDGVSVINDSYESSFLASDKVYIGVRVRNTKDVFFNGTLDEIMIWDKSLNSTEIMAIHNNQSSRFYQTGEMLFQNNNLGTNNTVNISIPNCQTLNGSYLQAKINDGGFVNFSSCNITNYPAEGNLTSANLTLRLNSGDNNFYTPLIIGNISLSGFDNVTPQVTISSPTNGSTSTSSSVSISVTTNENSTCNYSTNSGTTNSSLTPNSAGITHTATASSLSNGNYVLNIYCEDLQGNQNHTQNVSFTVAVPATVIEEETGGSTGLGGTYKPSQSSLEKGFSVNVVAGQKVKINYDDSETSEVEIKSVSSEGVVVTIGGTDYEVLSSASRKIDLDNDGTYDLEITSNKVYSNGIANLGFKLISEPVSSEEQEEQESNVGEKISNAVEKVNWGVYVIVGVVIVLVVVWVVLMKKRRNV